MWIPSLKKGLPAYRALLEALTSDVRDGRLATGERLPPQRDLARALGLSVGTVTRAYSLAERQGLVRGEVGRGTFVGPSPESPPVGDLRESIDGAVNLSMSWPLPSLDPDLGAALRELGRDPAATELLSYQPNAGSYLHRGAGVNWLSRFGLEVPADRVAVCAGSQHAMTVALGTVLQPGDTLLCEELTYPGIRAAADFLKLGLHGLACDAEGLLPDAFEQACARSRGRALYTVPTLHNPTSVTQSLERRNALAQIARRHDVIVIEDAIHHLLHGSAPPPIASLAPEQTIFIGSPSKVVAGGLRVAFLTAPPVLMSGVTHAIWATTWMVPPLCAEIFRRWMEDGTVDRTVKAKRAEARDRVALAREVLAGLPIEFPEAAYHLWIPIPESSPSAAQFTERAARHGLLLASSEAFHTGLGKAPRAVRVCLSAPRSRETLRRGLQRLAETWRADPSRGAALV